MVACLLYITSNVISQSVVSSILTVVNHFLSPLVLDAPAQRTVPMNPFMDFRSLIVGIGIVNVSRGSRRQDIGLGLWGGLLGISARDDL